MFLERIEGLAFLKIDNEISIFFHNEWLVALRPLPYDQYGDFIRSSVYPALSAKERKIWNKFTISNRALHGAIKVFK